MLTISKVINNTKNQSVINYLSAKDYSKELEFLSEDIQIEKQKLNVRTHPDIIELLWGDYTNKIPVRCQMILFGSPVLINPNTGIVFGFAEGTNPPLLKLSETDMDIYWKREARYYCQIWMALTQMLEK